MIIQIEKIGDLGAVLPEFHFSTRREMNKNEHKEGTSVQKTYFWSGNSLPSSSLWSTLQALIFFYRLLCLFSWQWSSISLFNKDWTILSPTAISRVHRNGHWSQMRTAKVLVDEAGNKAGRRHQIRRCTQAEDQTNLGSWQNTQHDSVDRELHNPVEPDHDTY